MMDGRPTTRRSKDFQRVYKACESCRKKKIRCVLDGTGNPPQPPCARCKRELRECIFSPERSYRKRDAGQGRQAKDSQHGSMSDVSMAEESNIIVGQPALSPDDNDISFQPLENVDMQQQQPIDDQPVANPDDGLADTVMRTLVSSGNDALRLLFRAAEQREAESPRHLTSVSHASQQGDFTSPGNLTSITPETVQRSQATAEVLEVWDAFRFVKMGWFTAEEAVTYMDLFFKNLAPLSPVCQDFDASHENHFTLITQEPLLTCTMLMISSRYHILPGAGGISRSTLIHQRLWEHCQHLVMRIMFGQEKRSKAKTRTIGAIEALLLIIEWHPKAIHFPPAADGWDSDILLTTSDRRDNPLSNRADVTDDPSARWLGDVVTPARMSDRLSWMLLGCAQSLAHELGICDMNNKSEPPTPQRTSQAARRLRLRKLLFIFLEQLSFRLGCTSTVSVSLSRCSSEQSSDPDESVYMSAWIELTNLLRTIHDVLFPSASAIKQLLLSGRYVNIIKHFQQQLLAWKMAHLIPGKLRPNWYQELLIEYNYVRIFMNSLGMQAIVDRALEDGGPNAGQPNLMRASMTPTDYEFIQEVLDGSCQTLQSVIKFAEAGTLRFCPVRLFLRIIGASIFLLKALSLGAHTSNIEASLITLENSIKALHASSLDDMHLASRYATLLDVHVARFRQCLIPSTVPRGIPPPELNNFNWEDNGDLLQMNGNFSTELPNITEDWLSLPFDPSMAPFGLIEDSFDVTEIEDRAWDFLWNLPIVE